MWSDNQIYNKFLWALIYLRLYCKTSPAWHWTNRESNDVKVFFRFDRNRGAACSRRDKRPPPPRGSFFPLATAPLSPTPRALFKRGRCQHKHEVTLLISSRFAGLLAPATKTTSHLVAQIGKPLCPVAIANIFEPWWCSHTNISSCTRHPRLTVHEWKRKSAFYHSYRAVS